MPSSPRSSCSWFDTFNGFSTLKNIIWKDFVFSSLWARQFCNGRVHGYWTQSSLCRRNKRRPFRFMPFDSFTLPPLLPSILHGHYRHLYQNPTKRIHLELEYLGVLCLDFHNCLNCSIAIIWIGGYYYHPSCQWQHNLTVCLYVTSVKWNAWLLIFAYKLFCHFVTYSKN